LLSIINLGVFKLLNNTVFMLIGSRQMPCCFIPKVSLMLFIGLGYIQDCEFKHRFSCLSSHLSAEKNKNVLRSCWLWNV